ncbi:MAG: hypothetical protein CR989_05055 [Flavobacteriales bacterium]|nr:MAG: hypothetical protein CR989_05055 [Flavobacteriales bacterium]
MVIGVLFMSNAQEISIGGGLGFNDAVDGPGAVAKAEFGITENIAISPSLSYFAGSKIYGYKRNIFSVDANGHYKIPIMQDELNVYPLAGFNYSSYRYGDYDYLNEYEVKDNSIGFNIGGGGRWYFSDQFSVFAELKYVISDYSQVVFVGGVLYQL